MDSREAIFGLIYRRHHLIQIAVCECVMSAGFAYSLVSVGLVCDV